MRIIWNTQTQYVGKMQILLSRYLTLAVHVITTSLYGDDKRGHPPALYNSSVQRRIFLWLLNCLRGWKWLPPRRSPPHPTKELRSNQKETKNTIKIARQKKTVNPRDTEDLFYRKIWIAFHVSSMKKNLLSCEAYSFFILPKFHDLTPIFLFAFNAICCQSSPFLGYSYTVAATRCEMTATVEWMRCSG